MERYLERTVAWSLAGAVAEFLTAIVGLTIYIAGVCGLVRFLALVAGSSAPLPHDRFYDPAMLPSVMHSLVLLVGQSSGRWQVAGALGLGGLVVLGLLIFTVVRAAHRSLFIGAMPVVLTSVARRRIYWRRPSTAVLHARSDGESANADEELQAGWWFLLASLLTWIAVLTVLFGVGLSAGEPGPLRVAEAALSAGVAFWAGSVGCEYLRRPGHPGQWPIGLGPSVERI